LVGDVTWPPAPFAPPGKGASGGSGGGDGAADGAGDDGADGDDGDDGGLPPSGFITMSDGGGGVSFECDLFAQDCMEGEKCMPWANDGGPLHNATRCSPVDPDPGQAGEPCSVEGSGVSGIDDCALGSMCWDVDAQGEGTCVAMCGGSAEAPLCDSGFWCYQGNDGALSLCLEDAVCEDDGVCQCMCAADPNCEPEQCAGVQRAEAEVVLAPPVPHYDAAIGATECPATMSPIDLYMSSDDSNSQASAALARRAIQEGRLVPPEFIRVHEFLNYYDFASDLPTDRAAELGIEMRRTDAETGEFAMMLLAKGRRITTQERPPLDLVLAVDTSLSMRGERLELAKASMATMAHELKVGDVVSVLKWGGTQTVLLDGHAVTGADDPVLLDVIDAVEPYGGTDLHAGLVSGYALANEHRIEGGLARVVLLSDGGANLGATSEFVIGSAAFGGDERGIFLVGVGVGTADGYRDDLMDAATDAGRGAYVFIDGPAEAQRQFSDNFISNLAVAARDVKMKVTLPWYFGVRAYHGEQISSSPQLVRPQHLAPNDVMAFHSVISACDPSFITECDAITAELTYTEPGSGRVMHEEIVLPLGEAVTAPAAHLPKAEVVVSYAKALIVIAWLAEHGEWTDAYGVADAMTTWLADAAEAAGDAELVEISGLMATYRATLAVKAGL
jgi:Ca-activated chloride channel family protein